MSSVESCSPASQVKGKRRLRRSLREAWIGTDPVQYAKMAGLRYVMDSKPGIRRKRSGKGFSYTDAQGALIRDRAVLNRIKALVIPAAWKDVWISPLAEGHLQATGRDAKGRKQYLYHPLWRQVSGEVKFNRMVAFGNALPKIRERIEQDLSLPGLARNKVLATVVRLLEMTLIRIGNKEYVRQNQSFGLTTMRDDHIDVSGSVLRFQFRGKSGKEHTIEVQDRRLARIVKRCRDIPGHELFQYIDEEGQRRTLDSSDVNAYLQEITGEHFTAKDFRTWGGTVHAAHALMEIGPFDSDSGAKKCIVQMVKAVSQHLGNKPAICRKYYVHPALIEAYLEGSLLSALSKVLTQEEQPSVHPLQPMELAVLELLTKYDEARS